MNKADKFKLLYILGISLIFYFIGCVDTSVQTIPNSIDYNSQMQLINLASLSGTATIDVVNADGAVEASTQLDVGSAYPENLPFMDIPSGTKTFNVTFTNSSFNTSFRLTMDTERKIRLLLINPDSNSTNLIKSDERYTWQEKNSENAGNLYPADSSSISFFNASLVPVDTIIVQGESLEESSLDVGNAIGYMIFPASGTSITFKDTVNLATTSVDAQSQGRYSAILYGTQGNLQAKVFTDD